MDQLPLPNNSQTMKRSVTVDRLLPLFIFSLSVVSLSALPVRVLAWDEDIAARKLAIVHSKGVVELKNLDSFSRSRAFNIVGTDEVPVTLQAKDRVDEEGVPFAQPIPIPPALKRPLLLLLPDEKSESGIRTIVLEDDLANFRWGTIRMINSTGRELVFRWEKKLAELPAAWDPVTISPGGDTRNMGVAMFLRERPDPPLYSAVWEHRDDARTLVFAVPGTDTTRSPVEFKFILETPEDLAAAEKAAKKKNP